MSKTAREDYIDKQVGMNVRRFREMRNFTQEKLAGELGITFQQVQKYEKGTNGIRASRLVQISKVLEVSVPNLLGDTASQFGQTVSTTDMQMLHLFQQLNNNVQNKIIALLKAFTGEAS